LYAVRSLPRRIKDLREQGYDIVSDKRKDLNGQRYVRYNMA
jgi:biotin operon repressor